MMIPWVKYPRIEQERSSIMSSNALRSYSNSRRMVFSSFTSPALCILPSSSSSSMSYRTFIIDRATVAEWMDSQKSAVEFNEEEEEEEVEEEVADGAALSIRSRSTSPVSQF